MVVREFVAITAAVEGDVDEAVVRCLIEHIQAKTCAVYGRTGKSHLQRRLSGYNQAARFSPWIVLVDLDHDAECAPPFRDSWLPDPSQYMCFRIAVRAVEAWLMADREHLARFLSVEIARIPQNVEAVDHPKLTMVEIARHSRPREIREDMIPRTGSGRVVGPAYTARLIEFVVGARNGWRPKIAAERSQSLKRCLRCLHRLKEVST
jgi:hypothetical protein